MSVIFPFYLHQDLYFYNFHHYHYDQNEIFRYLTINKNISIWNQELNCLFSSTFLAVAFCITSSSTQANSIISPLNQYFQTIAFYFFLPPSTSSNSGLFTANLHITVVLIKNWCEISTSGGGGYQGRFNFWFAAWQILYLFVFFTDSY